MTTITSKRQPSGVGTKRGQVTPQTKTTTPSEAERTVKASGRFFEIRIVTGYSRRSTQSR